MRLPRRLLQFFVALGLMCTSSGWVLAETITQTQRLSQWLAERQVAWQSDANDPLAVVWITPEERQRQQTAVDALAQTLNERATHRGDTVAVHVQTLVRILSRMPVTGRMPIAAADPRWLEVNSQRNPLLRPGDEVILPPKSNHVAVMTGSGEICQTLHQPGASVLAYLQACDLSSWTDRVWLIQPDGRISRVSVKDWLPEQQHHPAPGAWVWLGLKNEPDLSEAWAQWLATQPPADAWPAPLLAPLRRPAQHRVQSSVPPLIAQNQFAPQPTSSHWGSVGLLQTPTARMRKEGSFSLNFERTWPYLNGNVYFQPLDWLEGGFRYTSVANRLYGPEAYSGDQAYKDKSFDFKARLWRESDRLPEVALGMRDFAGTGLFSSEYLVASKRQGRLDASLGIGWGYLGGRANLKNPLSTLSSRFTQRQTDVGQGGTLGVNTWFHGPAALFAGLEYQSPSGRVFKAEYDGNNYQREPQANNQLQKSPVNFGVVFKPLRSLDVSLGWERGNTLSLGFTIYTDLSTVHMAKVSDPPTPGVALQRPKLAPHWSQTAADIGQQTQWRVEQLALKDDTLVVQASQSHAPYTAVRLDKAMAVLHRDAPEEVQTVVIEHRAAGELLASETVDREDWVQQKNQPARSQVPATLPVLTYPEATTSALAVWRAQPTRFMLEPGLDFIQTLGGPDGFFLYQFSLAARLGLQLPWNIQAKGLLRARVLDNYDRFKTPGWSNMPRVRTHVREYFTTADVTLANLNVSQTGRASRDWYWGIYGGYFEEMFGGSGAEVLYRQPGSRWAVGVDVNKVRQRNFAQDFGFQEYRANTGHVTGYWLTPIEGIHASLSAGQYLAGDKGATLTVSKVFSNGVTLGAFATKTNVPAAIFGEGSFDKGVYWSIPFDALMTRSSRSYANFTWKPLTRDGGARVVRPVNLFAETVWLAPDARAYAPVVPADRLPPP